MSDKSKPQGLPWEFIRSTCWAGDDRSKWCRYLRGQRGVFTCGKGTAAGIRHSKLIDGLVADRAADADVVVFDSGSPLVPQPDPQAPTCQIHAGDNCPGRASEFLQLRKKTEVQ